MSNNKLFLLIVGLYLGYLAYLTWGAGKLAIKMVDQVNLISCRPDCKLKKAGRDYPVRDNCLKFCKDIK